MKKKMTLLQEGIVRYHENSDCRLWFQGSPFTEETEKKIAGFAKFSNPEEERDFHDFLDDLEGEYYWAGMIDGFRTCMGLVKELAQFENPHFLRNLLTDLEDREILNSIKK